MIERDLRKVEVSGFPFFYRVKPTLLAPQNQVQIGVGWGRKTRHPRLAHHGSMTVTTLTSTIFEGAYLMRVPV